MGGLIRSRVAGGPMTPGWVGGLTLWVGDLLLGRALFIAHMP